MKKNEQITLREKRTVLKRNGWYTFWDDDAWLDGKKIYKNAHVSALHTNDAYNECLKDINNKNKK